MAQLLYNASMIEYGNAGSSRGIGQCIAELYAKEGAKLILTAEPDMQQDLDKVHIQNIVFSSLYFSEVDAESAQSAGHNARSGGTMWPTCSCYSVLASPEMVICIM